MLLSDQWKPDSNTQISFRNPATNTIQGNTGGLSLIGGTASGDDLTLSSTSNATKGTILLGVTNNIVIDEVNGRLGVGIAAPSVALEMNATTSGSFTDIFGLTRYAPLRSYRNVNYNFGAETFCSAASFELLLDPTAAGGFATNGFVSYVATPTTASFNINGTTRALNPAIRNRGNVNMVAAYAIGGEASNFGTGTITTLAAMNFGISNLGGGTVTTAALISLNQPIGGSGSTNTWTTIRGIDLPNLTPSGSANTVTNAPEGILIRAQTTSGAMAIRQQGTTAHSRFEGQVTMGADATPAASAALDISTTTGALLVPRMTTTQRDALTAANGMIVYNTTTGAFNFYEGGAWVTK